MNRQTDLTFYSQLKGEDAEPYLDDSLLVVADGLGGSGSAVHSVAWESFPDRDRAFREAAFGDFEEENGLKDELMQWSQLITDEVPDTSALWASRIVIARFVYAMTHMDQFRLGDMQSESLRKELSDFVHAGLQRVADTFSLSVGKYGNQLLLPTTLAAVKYVESEESVTAEAIWAGDSRCYALTKNGLKLISKDDEDASGAITNLFYVGGRHAELHYRKVTLPKPCAFLAVSDGTFDPFEPHDHFGLEYILLHTMIAHMSVEELSAALQNTYEKIHADDATMAFAAFGFSDYKSMWEYFGERTQYIEEVWTDLCNRKAELEAKNAPNGETMDYVFSRTAVKFEAIIAMLTSCVLENRQDICLGKEFSDAIDEAKRSVAETEKSLASRREAAFEKLRNAVLCHKEYPNDFLRNVKFSALMPVLSEEECRRLKGDHDGIMSMAKIVRKGRNKQHEYENQVKNHIRNDAERIKQKVENLSHAVRDLIEKHNFQAVSSIADKALDEIRADAQKSAVKQKEQTDKCLEWEQNHKTAEANLNVRIDDYLSLAFKHPALLTKLFNEAFLGKFWESVPEQEPEAVKEEIERAALNILRPKKADVVRAIVSALGEHSEETSAIDTFYTSSRLQNYRNQCRLQRDPDPSLEELERLIRELEKGYEEQ